MMHSIFLCIPMTATLQDLTDIWYDILREEENVSAYPLAMMQMLMNTASVRIANGKLKNPFTGKSVSKWVLPFLRSQAFYKSVPVVYTTAEVLQWATVVPVGDTTNFPTAWKIYIWWYITPYTGKTSTSFTWCTSIPVDFVWGSQVSIVYDLPADFGTPINLVYNQTAQIEWVLYDDIFERLNGVKLYGNRSENNYNINSWYRTKPFYSIKDNQYLLVYQINDVDIPMVLRYEKLPTAMVNTTDECFIPNEIYAKATIPYLAIGEMLYNRWEEWRAAQLINFALWQVEEMYTYYNNTIKEDPSGKQYYSAKWPRRLNI